MDDATVSMAATETLRGRVKWFNPEKGYGFLIREDTNREVFVHYTSIETDGFKTLEEGQLVEFALGGSTRGPHAEHVRVLAQSDDSLTQAIALLKRAQRILERYRGGG